MITIPLVLERSHGGKSTNNWKPQGAVLIDFRSKFPPKRDVLVVVGTNFARKLMGRLSWSIASYSSAVLCLSSKSLQRKINWSQQQPSVLAAARKGAPPAQEADRAHPTPVAQATEIFPSQVPLAVTPVADKGRLSPSADGPAGVRETGVVFNNLLSHAGARIGQASHCGLPVEACCLLLVVADRYRAIRANLPGHGHYRSG